jgi:hypothetical protein
MILSSRNGHVRATYLLGLRLRLRSECVTLKDKITNILRVFILMNGPIQKLKYLHEEESKPIY